MRKIFSGTKKPARAAAAAAQVQVPPLVAAKLALYQAMCRQKVSNVELARRLGVTEAVVRRLVNPDHASRIERVQSALAALHVGLIVEDADERRLAAVL